MSKSFVLPCRCGYPLCHIVIIKEEEQVNLIYKMFYGKYGKRNFFTRLYHWFREGRKAEFEYDVMLTKQNIDILKSIDPTVSLTVQIFVDENNSSTFEDEEVFSIGHQVYFNKNEMSFADLWNYLIYGGISKRMLRCITNMEIIEYLID